MSVTSSQIRAGRALLGWSQQDLAARALITQVTVANIENDKTGGSRSSLKAIRVALENEGVNFVENGVVRTDDFLSVWAGEDAYLRLLDDIYFSLKENKGETLFMGADERKNLPGVSDVIRKMKSAGIRLRIIIEEDNYHILGDLDDYRQIPTRYFANAVSVIYGDKYAILVGTPETFRVCLVKNEAVLKAQRGVFDFFWENGKRPARRDVLQVY
jgi:transcriptional regulator with XRE-family HTH domain